LKKNGPAENSASKVFLCT